MNERYKSASPSLSDNFRGYDEHYYSLIDGMKNSDKNDHSRNGTVIPASDYLALLTGKQLTEGKKPTIENTCFYHDGSKEAIEVYRACCRMLDFDKESDGYEGSFMTVDGSEKCIIGHTEIPKEHTHISISDYFKLLPTQESVKGEINSLQSLDDAIKLVSPFGTASISNPKVRQAIHDWNIKQTAHLQQQLKQAKELLKEIDEFAAYPKYLRVKYNQFLTRNK